MQLTTNTLDPDEYMLPEVTVTAPRMLPEEPPLMRGAPQPVVSPLAPAPLQQEAPLPVQRAQGIDLNQLMARYINQPTEDYGAQLREARQQRQQATTAFDEYLKRLISEQTEDGPSKAEMYFRLAAAFAAPTKTGHFAESMGQAAQTISEYKKEQREARKTGKVTRQQLELERIKLAMQGAKDEETTLRALAAEDIKDRRALMTEYLKSGKPLSEAGKAAFDLGLEQGTPEYDEFVRGYIKDKVVTGNLLREAQLAIAQGQLGVSQGQLGVAMQREQRAQAEAQRLTPKEVDLRLETEETLSAMTSAEKALEQALKLNSHSFDGSLADIAQRKVLEAMGSSNQKVVNTRNLENLLASQALTKLKSIFGGAPTEGERAIAVELEGMGAKSLRERELIIRRSLGAARAKRLSAQKRLQEIRSGTFRETTGGGE